MLYKHVFKLDDSFSKLVGPSKVDFDRRYMTKPPDKNYQRKSKLIFHA